MTFAVARVIRYSKWNDQWLRRANLPPARTVTSTQSNFCHAFLCWLVQRRAAWLPLHRPHLVAGVVVGARALTDRFGYLIRGRTKYVGGKNPNTLRGSPTTCHPSLIARAIRRSLGSSIFLMSQG
jgi:hypothetical protein